MEVTNAISLQIIHEAMQFKESECEVLLNGKATGVKVSGKVLEAAVKVDDVLYLIFLTDDVVFEESLNIFLIGLGRNNTVVDYASIGAMYSTGMFKNIRIASSDSVVFDFMDDVRWKVIVHASPKLRVPFINEDKRVARPVGFKRYFSISENSSHEKSLNKVN
ncbi:hypothetical protein F6Q07_16520 [Pectobacterium parmentieri]|uniref:hypothetical protein n=1 Tax=Pectobacterium parmentieri TaxID=1905730 RepID=UPI000EABBB0E|nr:hypothetical protein [Pectobacterium parmentieri]AYH00917.1 hypothetical protein C5E26_08205 [Pectobacterium parmentieri]AYH27226.1 hypothetical protein C5E20_08850 [Pectobacterium parmentieri]AYH31539.1 hypothetical protein C5E19_07895 [Pectobacterium parmentieri]MBI0519731.1 hypothetical protein [Pectobacterium parmentieri]